ncbi:hypothetical protein XHV734_1275 [Xanthomonas hortorum pv. vitians]|nr:hypothetical protein XHV734_1275 [Xanthomonas hortorum pv. vitians]
MRVRAKPSCRSNCTRLRSYPHPPLRGTFSRREKDRQSYVSDQHSSALHNLNLTPDCAH